MVFLLLIYMNFYFINYFKYFILNHSLIHLFLYYYILNLVLDIHLIFIFILYLMLLLLNLDFNYIVYFLNFYILNFFKFNDVNMLLKRFHLNVLK